MRFRLSLATLADKRKMYNLKQFQELERDLILFRNGIGKMRSFSPVTASCTDPFCADLQMDYSFLNILS